MAMLDTITITGDSVLDEVTRLKNKGYRLVTMSCIDLGDDFDVLYHFDLDLKMVHLRLTSPKGEHIPSISGIYLAAFLIENETKDHFGIDFDGIALDFGGNLYLEPEVKKFPFCKVSVTKKNEQDGGETCQQ